MKVVSVINYKGGVGKTTITANLSAELAWRGYNVLMIDLDPQASLTFSFIQPDVWEKDFSKDKTIKSWFDSFKKGSPLALEALIHTPYRVEERLNGRGSLDIIYSHLGLINVDLDLATKLGGATLAEVKSNFINIHRRLANGLASIEEGKYDLVLIDCPPNFNIVTKTAIVASDNILVPARPDYLSTMGIDYLIRSVDGLVKDYNEYASVVSDEEVDPISPALLGVIFTMIQEYGGQPLAAQRQYIEQVRQLPKLAVLDHYVKRNDSLFADAPQYGVPVVLHGYRSGSHQSVVDGLEDVVSDFQKSVGI